MTATPTGRRTVLVIDDDRDVTTYLEAVLHDGGYAVVTANDGATGLRLASERAPDLICLDIVMPDPTGVRIYRDLRGDPALRHVPIVIVTGIQPEFKEFIHSRKFVPPPDGYIGKPFDPGELLETVARLLAPRAAGTAPSRTAVH